MSATSTSLARPASQIERVASAFIICWLALQLALPLTYYLGAGDPYDERFAWRMFSPTRMTKCRVALFVGGPTQRRNALMGTELHAMWRGWLIRGRSSVADAYLEERCRRQRAAGEATPWASMELTCRRPDQSWDLRMSRQDNRCAP